MNPKITIIDTSTGEIETRPMTDEELAKYEADIEATPE